MSKTTDNGRTGILVNNLGTPDAPTTVAVRAYLAEFLADKRIIHLPSLLWWPILHGLILRRRPAPVARNYAKIWTTDGSPLLVISQQISDAIHATLNSGNQQIPVALGMRYGTPSILDALRELQQAGATRLVVLPLYPQYSDTTTTSTKDCLETGLKQLDWAPDLHFIDDYHDNHEYIKAVAASIEDYQSEHGKPDRLLMSFHGLPQDYADAGDPYPQQCQVTAQAVADQLDLIADRWQLSFQSRFGPRKWLQPYTEPTLAQWARDGVRNVQVVCPGFAADCLETLEEISIRARDTFLKAGGKTFAYIPALNADPAHASALTAIIRRVTPATLT